MRKQSSSNTINKIKLETNCGMAYTISVLSGRWKLSILGFLLDNGKLRYGELKRKVIGISEKMLINQLKELEGDGLINRIAYPEVPPRVEYELSDKGKTLENILVLMSSWGEGNTDNRIKT
ncbi:winged helix-turn-helix transcriptional regulator [Sphingobacterium pedocola]|uniref:Transcriptional regulator n=1 Tax=Sphingobacterium pedocola TaxID=2082722 RepID=A0ABR9T3X1_9SPHI|nr:winged helix-turn-helix transcriptional regulator [Sphingobacterium pedocola]MBE8719362.1 transcriptional regulator [Sphingobacterium pedocola]